MTLELSEAVLARRVFNKAVNDRLQRDTILRELGPYLDPERAAIDVGAATGHITYFLSPRCKNVFSFEAVPPVYQQLKKMDALGNVTTFNSAVGTQTGLLPFFVDDKRLSNSGFQDLVNGPCIDVLTVTLDSMFEGIDIGFIKIDVEGTELDVLRGADRLLEEQRPVLMVEIYEPYSKYPLDDIFVHFFERGYRCYYFTPSRGLIECDGVTEGVYAAKALHSEHDGDFLFVPLEFESRKAA